MIKLTSERYQIIEIKKKTKAKIFTDFKIGDLIYFEMGIKHNTKWSGGGGVYASDVRTVNINQSISVIKSQSELVNILNRSFVLKEVNDNE